MHYTFVKALQTLNGARPYPPYLLELDDAREVEDALTRCWICGEKSERCENARTLSLFDKQKVKEEHVTCEEGVYPKLSNKLAFIGAFFDSDGRVLLQKKRTQTGILYDFAIRDYVLKDEYDSLMGLQRAVRQCFGFDFYFGDLAPAVTLTQKRLILDFYVVPHYDVPTEELCGDGKDTLEWFTREEFFDLIAANRFESYPQGLLTLLYGL